MIPVPLTLPSPSTVHPSSLARSSSWAPQPSPAPPPSNTRSSTSISPPSPIVPLSNIPPSNSSLLASHASPSYNICPSTSAPASSPVPPHLALIRQLWHLRRLPLFHRQTHFYLLRHPHSRPYFHHQTYLRLLLASPPTSAPPPASSTISSAQLSISKSGQFNIQANTNRPDTSFLNHIVNVEESAAGEDNVVQLLWSLLVSLEVYVEDVVKALGWNRHKNAPEVIDLFHQMIKTPAALGQ